MKAIIITQSISNWMEVPDYLVTPEQVAAWLDENDRWPNIVDGQWLSAEIDFE